MTDSAHVVTITDLPNHPFFTLKVSCSCGATLYAINPAQAEQHKQWHLGWVKSQKQKLEQKQAGVADAVK